MPKYYKACDGLYYCTQKSSTIYFYDLTKEMPTGDFNKEWKISIYKTIKELQAHYKNFREITEDELFVEML